MFHLRFLIQNFSLCRQLLKNAWSCLQRSIFRIDVLNNCNFWTIKNFRYKSTDNIVFIINIFLIIVIFIIIIAVVITSRGSDSFVWKHFFVINFSDGDVITVLIVAATEEVGVLLWYLAQRRPLLVPESWCFVRSSTKWFPIDWRCSSRCNLRALLHKQSLKWRKYKSQYRKLLPASLMEKHNL